ncbi:hypothetical protein EUBDOL_02235 [Amedibacillus dolichus DSM 3991]|uniref:Uncharacterized protein n=1 Tax=Amedibacillus dolichus DSM 3991 TaxID=428127 RepID=A8RFG3_9FIRM|nr:hypothetical protein EUBDOL_02235 [Amedibacillus dolichus DSM 3991]
MPLVLGNDKMKRQHTSFAILFIILRLQNRKELRIKWELIK